MVEPNRRETMGKKLKRLNRLWIDDGRWEECKENVKLNEYRKYLESKGMVSDKLVFGEFMLESGAKYLGLMATQDIKGGEVLVRVPVDLLIGPTRAW